MSSISWMSSPNFCEEPCNIMGMSNDIEKIVQMENTMVFHSRDVHDYIISFHPSSSLPLCIGEDQDLQLCSTMDIPALDDYTQGCLTNLSTSLVHHNDHLADVFDCINHAILFENAIGSSAQCSSSNLTASTSMSEDGKDTSSQDLTSSTPGYDYEQSVVSNAFKSASASKHSFLASCNLLEDMLSESFASSATSTGARHDIDDGVLILGDNHEISTEALKIAGSERRSPSNMVSCEVLSGQSPSAGSECQSYKVGTVNHLRVQAANNAVSSTAIVNNEAVSSEMVSPDEHLMMHTNSEFYQLLERRGADQCSAATNNSSISCVGGLDCFDHRMGGRGSACSTMADEGCTSYCMQVSGRNEDKYYCHAGGAVEGCSSLLGTNGAAGPGRASENNEISSRSITSNYGSDTTKEGDQDSYMDWGASEPLSAAKEMLYRATALSWREDVDGEEEAAMMRAWRRRRRRRNVKVSKDPQSVAARQRRERISQKIRILQGLVPGGTKMDTASMLDEAVLYLKFLKSQIHQLSLLRPRPPLPPPSPSPSPPPPRPRPRPPPPSPAPPMSGSGAANPSLIATHHMSGSGASNHHPNITPAGWPAASLPLPPNPNFHPFLPGLAPSLQLHPIIPLYNTSTIDLPTS